MQSLQMRVAELGSEADAAQESAQRKGDALRAQLAAQRAELEASKNDLAATQARSSRPASTQFVTYRQVAGKMSMWSEGDRGL